MGAAIKLAVLPSSRRGNRYDANIPEHERDKQRQTPYVHTVDAIQDCPCTLKAEGKRRWIQFSTVMLARGIYSPDFFAALEHLCRLYDQLAAYDHAIGDTPAFTEKRGRGERQYEQIKVNPLLPYRQQTMLAIRHSLGDFGMTPASVRSSNIPMSNQRNSAHSDIETANDNDDAG